ncbi:hypothetical protein V2J09_004809 [Rumex salicifolius]
MQDTGIDLYQLGGSMRSSMRGSIRAVGDSLRSGSTSVWRNTGVDAFSTSTREEDDEDALTWAALEKLPTYDRLRKGILLGSKGAGNEVDIGELGPSDKKNLLDKLIRVTEEDNEKLLLKLKERIDRVGIDMPTIEVRYENLSIEAEVYVGSRALPSFINYITDMVEGLLSVMYLSSNKKKRLNILQDVSGIIKPNRMTLLLGPPSSGKTTLLLALAGKLDKGLKCDGRVTYNGHGMHEFVPQRTAAYISQHDVHLGELTVRETLSYSARFQGVGNRYEMLAELARREKEANIKPDPDIDLFMKAAATEGQKENLVTDYIIKILGLDVCADTMVGDQMVRGISGGQKKRVTTGEMLVGPARALFMDEISTGLDSSTTYQIVNSLRQTVHILNGTAVISLLQPAPETYDLFDDIILLSDGVIVYQGPRDYVLEFFEHMGFKCPDRKGVADFLQEVTSTKDQQQYWYRTDEQYRFIPSKEFAEAFQSFHVGRRLAQELSIPYDKTKSHPAALTTEKYGVGKKEIFKASISREWLLMKRSSFVYIFKISQLAIVGAIAMTVFFRTKFPKNLDNGALYTGALFFAVTMLMFVGMAEISMTISKLPVFFKQRELRFFPAWAYALPTWFLKIPLTIVEVGAWVFLTYYVIGFDPNVGRLFKQFLVLAVLNQMASAMFRFIGAAGRDMIVSSTFGSFAIMILFALGGFVLSRDNVKKWWLWGYWVSPMMYAQNAIGVNEFLGHTWSHIPAGNTTSIGAQALTSRGFFPHAYWYWLGTGALLGYVFLFNFLYTMCLTFLNPLEKHQAKVEEEKKGSEVELSQRGNNVNPAEPVQRGMVLPFDQHCITFDEVRYSVDMPDEIRSQGVTDERLELLKGISGAFRPGVLTALMGVSGAGKTTLMDVLAGRKTGGYIDGDIKVSGYTKNQETFARIAGYCEQNDIHSPHVTVYESLIYSAWLRLSPDVDAEKRKMFVEEVMELVELKTLRGALVGLPGVSGLSTEQRKRLTIAVELVANPSIIFMDEPTSGLDARAAAIVMRTVRNTVDTGRTVVCTIHQPSIDIFEAFDELFLLKRGGQEIYVGPLGHNSCELIKYFESIQGVQKIKDGYNPATWMLEVTTPSQELALGVDFTDLYRTSDLHRRNKALIHELGTPRPGSQDLHFPTQFAQPFHVQMMANLWKLHWSYWRNPPYTAVRMLFTTIIALLFGSIFWDLGKKFNKKQDLINAMGSMYASVIFIGVQNSSSVQPVVSVERTVFYREKAAGMYSPMAYALAQVLIEIPYIFVQAAVYGIIAYAMIGFDWTVAKFMWYLFFMFFTLMYFTFYGMMTVAVTPNHHIANIIAASFYSIWNLFCGFLIPRPNIPVWWRWYYWCCPVAWTLYGLLVSQFGDVTHIFEDTQQPVKDFVRDHFGYKHDFLGPVAIVVAGFAVLFAFTFAVSIKAFNFQKRLSNSMRSSLGRNSSSSVWRNTTRDVFSTSTRDEDDEEALKWAALEKLPTYDRLRRGILMGSRGGYTEIDIRNLGFSEKKSLVDKLISVTEQDNERFLLKLKNRIQRVGIEIPTIEVRFEHLSVKTEVYDGSRAVPTFFSFITNFVEGLLNILQLLPNRKKDLTILDDVSGVIKPNRMTLLLGPPSSGKTTFLLALAGKLDKELKCKGKVTYNGHEMNEFVPQRTAAYISQHDLHLGEMTVRETLAYSARFQGVGYRYEMLAELARREKEAKIMPDPDIDLYMKATASEGQKENVITDYILKLLGLEVCADTIVGDEMIRGISGGQRKRVTTGEMLVGPSRALFMDEISTGLDSSTTYQIVNALRQTVKILDGTALISLLLPAPETYDLFDDVILLTDGIIVYQGPRENVLEFFKLMGFKCPERKGVADFLQEVTSRKDQEQYWFRRDKPYKFITSKEFSEAFQSFHVGRRLKEEISVPFDKRKSHPAALTIEKYGTTKKEIFKATLSRELTQFHKDIDGGNIYMGALFFTVIQLMFIGAAEMSMTIAKLPVFYKQRDLLFFPAWAYALPTWFLKIPITLIEAGVWVFLTYYVIGFDPNVGRMFKQFLVLTLINQVASGLFRFIGAAGRNYIVVNIIGSFTNLLLFTLGGFILSRGKTTSVKDQCMNTKFFSLSYCADNMKPWILWGYWISPLMYAQNALGVNEFLGNSWSKIPIGSNESIGLQTLRNRGFFTHASWYWIAVGALVGFIIIFNTLFTLSLTFLDPLVKRQTLLPLNETEEKSVDPSQTVQRAMVLSFEQHSITFVDIRYSVDMPPSQGIVEDKLELLKGINGAFRPGVLTALMGVSGAGKTTLMDVLAGRKTGGYITGNVTVSGYPKKQDTFARISGYCEQMDIHSPHVTVYEALLYSAWLRLSPQMFVEEVMELVELHTLRGALVGLPGVSGLSIEQRKRLTIAVELVANPSIIFMDEPTSGLDARAAAIVMRAVRNTVDGGRTVRGGEEIYVGPVGHHSCHLIKYFESIPGVPKIKDGYNPATWMLEVTTPAQELTLDIDFSHLYKNSDLYKRNKALIQQLGTPHPGSQDLHFPTQYAQPFSVQLSAILWKQYWSYWRNPSYTSMRFSFTTIAALMFGAMFWDLGKKYETRQDLFNSMGCIYDAVLFLGGQYAAAVQPVVSVERSVFYREKAAGMYSPLPYALAHVLIEIPYIFVQAMVYGVIVYSMIGYEWSVMKFFWFMFFMFFSLLYYTFYGMMLIAITPNQHVASVMIGAFSSVWNLFSGFVIPRTRIPVWWRWYYWLCPVGYTLNGLISSQFGDVKTKIVGMDATVAEFITDYFGFRHDMLGVVAGVVLGFTLLFAFTFAFAIKVFNFQKR